MLQLKNIKKEYNIAGKNSVVLDNINLSFRNEEFVSILGASGNGKTTLLNIIGGLDKYTSGSLLVSGEDTSNFNDKQWDSYRNGTIGFVFQSYNLITHLSVLENVKLALSISGISAKEATQKSTEVLREVGLGEHINKKPTQLSGGQMQRVAIARALVTNPKIILADEPTGALDSKTSIQIMELIKKISKDKLVIMVTHNPELAKKYSDRIISVADGNITGDTNQFEYKKEENKYVEVPTSMSLLDSIKSSFKNLLTKKVRTFITMFAGSIGIISIGLVLSISSGMNKHIKTIEEENLSGMPISINRTQANLNMANRLESVEKDSSQKIKASENNELHKNLYSEDILGENNTFINYLENNAKNYYKNIEFSNHYSLKSLVKDVNNEVKEVKIEGARFSRRETLFTRLSKDKSILLNDYHIVASSYENFEYPTKPEELILYVGKDNSINKSVLRALGYNDEANLEYKDLLNKELSIVTNDNYYTEKDNNFTVAPINEELYDKGVKAKIVAIVKPNDDVFSDSLASIGYTTELEEKLINIEKNSKIVQAQKDDSSKNVLTKSKINEDNYEELLSNLGGSTKPSAIHIYPSTFENREQIVKVIENYNKEIANKYTLDSEDYNKYKISYLDMVKNITDILSNMINTITIILTAFAAISLVVSSVMIGILTYVSVIERTKEIGILRAIGARKKDITRIFNAEAGIIGVVSGVIGVGVASLLSIPLSNAVREIINAPYFKASIPLEQMAYLIILSLFLTLIASIIPAKIAAKKKPVEALRTE